MLLMWASSLMSAPTMNEPGLPLITATARTASSVARRSSIPSSSRNAGSVNLFTFSPGRSNVSQAIDSRSTLSVQA